MFIYVGFLVGFIGGFFRWVQWSTHKNPPGFFGYVPECLNSGWLTVQYPAEKKRRKRRDDTNQLTTNSNTTNSNSNIPSDTFAELSLQRYLLYTVDVDGDLVNVHRLD